MTDILVRNDGNGWDIVLEDGDLVMTASVSRIAEVTQRVVYEIMTWLGESPYDRQAGVPYIDTIFGSRQPGAVADYFTNLIAAVEGVDEILDEPTYVLGDDRIFKITVRFRVGTEDATLSVGVSPP